MVNWHEQNWQWQTHENCSALATRTDRNSRMRCIMKYGYDVGRDWNLSMWRNLTPTPSSLINICKNITEYQGRESTHKEQWRQAALCRIANLGGLKVYINRATQPPPIRTAWKQGTALLSAFQNTYNSLWRSWYRSRHTETIQNSQIQLTQSLLLQFS